MTTSPELELANKIAAMIKDHSNWFQLNSARYAYISGGYTVYIERLGDTDEVYRITWQKPEEVRWESKTDKKQATPGFEILAEACDMLCDFFRQELCQFTIDFIASGWTGVSIGKSNQSLERESYNFEKWLRNQQGLSGRWFWSNRSNTFWFTHEEDAVLFKTANIGDVQ